jgi:lipoprotein signal peptidase
VAFLRTWTVPALLALLVVAIDLVIKHAARNRLGPWATAADTLSTGFVVLRNNRPVWAHVTGVPNGIATPATAAVSILFVVGGLLLLVSLVRDGVPATALGFAALVVGGVTGNALDVLRFAAGTDVYAVRIGAQTTAANPADLALAVGLAGLFVRLAVRVGADRRRARDGVSSPARRVRVR